MGWYNDPNFSWDDFNSTNGQAPACSLKKKSETSAPAPAPAAPAPSPAPAKQQSGNTACPLPSDATPPPPPPDVDFIYHLCQKSKWMEAKARKQPYFPPTYMADGRFTRMTVFKEDIVSTANEYYKSVPGDWIVLEINCSTLYSLGIAILAQDAPESKGKKEPVKCLQVFGGISTSLPGLVNKIYRMKRSGNGTFTEIIEPAESTRSTTPRRNTTPPRKTAEDEKKEETAENKETSTTKQKKGGFLSKIKGKSNK